MGKRKSELFGSMNAAEIESYVDEVVSLSLRVHGDVLRRFLPERRLSSSGETISFRRYGPLEASSAPYCARGTCTSCRWFRILDPLKTRGECHAYPPDEGGKWPTVFESDWCGSYEND